MTKAAPHDHPLRIYPPDASIAPSSSPLLQYLLSLTHAPVAVIGILCANYDAIDRAIAFANRLMSKCALQSSDFTQHSSSICVFYDAERSYLFVVGIAGPETAYLATSVDDRTKCEHEQRRMEFLVYASCHLVYVVRESARCSTNLLPHVRAIASEKQQVLVNLSSTTSKSSKRDGKQVQNAWTPGRCVPHVLFVVPGTEEILQATHKQLGGIKSRSVIVSYCKALESMLCTLLRSLRGGLVGAVRIRDAFSSINLAKERRVFNLDPAHCVVIVSEASVRNDHGSSTMGRMEQVLSQLSLDDLPEEEEQEDRLLDPLVHDDVGFPHVTQFMTRYADAVFAQSASSSSSTRDRDSGARTELLSVAHWLRALHAVIKTLQRLDLKKKQDADAQMGGVASPRSSPPTLYQ